MKGLIHNLVLKVSINLIIIEIVKKNKSSGNEWKFSYKMPFLQLWILN